MTSNAAHSMVSNRKTSTVTDLKSKDKHSMMGAKGFNTSSVDGATGSQVGLAVLTHLSYSSSGKIRKCFNSLNT